MSLRGVHAVRVWLGPAASATAEPPAPTMRQDRRYSGRRVMGQGETARAPLGSDVGTAVVAGISGVVPRRASARRFTGFRRLHRGNGMWGRRSLRVMPTGGVHQVEPGPAPALIQLQSELGFRYTPAACVTAAMIPLRTRRSRTVLSCQHV